MARDRTLDIVKGLACLLMVLAHPKTMHVTVETGWTTFLWYVGFFAPVVFFASVGISLRYQLKKRTRNEIALSNLLLLAVVYVSQAFNFDSLFTSLTISSIIAAFLLRWNSAFLIAGVKLADELLNYLHISQRHIHGSLFSVVPWVGFILLGDYLHKNKKLAWPVLAASSGIAAYLGWQGGKLYDQTPSMLFVSVGLALYSLFVLIAPHLERVTAAVRGLSFLGRNTLLFWWVHLFLLKTVFAAHKLYAPYTWILLLLSASILMSVLNRLNSVTFARVSGSIVFWIACPLVYTLVMLLPGSARLYAGNPILFIFALNYHNFLSALRKLTSRGSAQPVDIPA